MSLRARLLLITAVLLVAGIVVSDAVVTAALRRHLVERVDRQLHQFAQVLSKIDPNLLDVAVNSRTRNLTSGLDLISTLAVTYRDAGGAVVRRAQSGPSPQFDVSAVPAQAGAPLTVGGWRAVVAPRDDGGSVVVAASLSAIDAIVGQVRLVCLITGLVVVAVLTGVGWLAIRAGLRPLRTIEETATAIAGGNLAQRIPQTGPPHTEVARLAAVLNGMLTQIEGAFTARAESEGRMRRFVADVSHELRTPLFGIKGSAELYLMRGAAAAVAPGATAEPGATAAPGAAAEPGGSRPVAAPLAGASPAGALPGDVPSAGVSSGGVLPGGVLPGGVSLGDVEHTMRRIDTEAGRLAALVEDLLLLARLDEPAAGSVLDLAPMDLRTLAADARHDLLALDPGRPVRLTGPATGEDVPPAPGPALVLGDEARLRQVVVNLVGNVHAHTPPDTAVRIGVGLAGEEAVLEIADSGPGLSGEHAERAFERFYRADGSRTRAAASGAGLGLAIVRSLVTAHGGRVEVGPTPGGGATFRIHLPRQPQSAEHSQKL
ncbi:HAMP domain-containing sensor histidine kinase [Actinoplanes sp. NPDC024001]|uniref:sensor histidine kinase n=1 Tax=Actinoplanes sp. NPDC024001 TaxID=3154598 RepID=UPI0033ECD54D